MSVYASVGAGAGFGGEPLKASSFLAACAVEDPLTGRPSTALLRSSFSRSVTAGSLASREQARSFAASRQVTAGSLASKEGVSLPGRTDATLQGQWLDDSESEKPAIEPSSLYGLYINFVLNGLIQGFFQKYMYIPICFFVFGPAGPGGNVTYAQCGIATAIFGLPWCFKGFYGLLIDKVPFFGSRRKGWIIFGWTGAIIIVVVLALFCEELVKEHAFVSYVGFTVLCCCFYLFSEVAGDGMSVELSRLESEERRGSILVTGQMLRQGSQVLANLLGFFTMNGGIYCAPYCSGSELPFHVSFRGVHIILACMAVPLYLVMCVTLKDPPTPPGGHAPHEPLKESMGKLWQIFQTRSMLSIIILSIGNYGISGIGNPAGGAIASIVRLTTVWVSIAGFLGTALFVLGVWVFKTFFLRKNWRILAVMVGFILLLDNVFTFITIYNVGGIGQDPWFVSLGPSVWIADVLGGFKWQIMGLAVIEIAPQGLEATTLEIYCALAHGAGTLAATFRNSLIPVFHINEIGYATYHNADPAVVDQYNTYMMQATVFSMILSFGSLMAFVSFQPTSKEQTREWNKQWHTKGVGVTGIVLAVVTFVYAVTVAIADILPATSCHKWLGGQGCP